MSVLAHVISNSKLQDEPASTQALAFILNQDVALVSAIVRMLQIEFDPGQVFAEEVEKGSRVDLTIYDFERKERILIENKFWAGLTDSQPIEYIDKLPSEQSALVFIVPEKRRRTIWGELRNRCESEGRYFEENPGEVAIFRAKVIEKNSISKNLLVTSWKHTLSQLLKQANSVKNKQVKRDILQLQGLTEKMDDDAFLPLRASELSDQQIARRIKNYVNLISEIVKELQDKKIAETESRSGSFNELYFGQYLILHGRFKVWLGLHFEYWKVRGKTPLWLTFESRKDNNGDWRDVDYKCIERILNDRMIEKERNYLFKPILLKVGSEQENVVSDAVSSIVDIAEKLNQEYYADQPLD